MVTPQANAKGIVWPVGSRVIVAEYNAVGTVRGYLRPHLAEVEVDGTPRLGCFAFTSIVHVDNMSRAEG